MAETINMPKLGFDMAEGTLIRWMKKEGEAVAKGEVLAEIETDKATVEVESTAEGVVRRLVVDEGAVVPVGAAIAIVGTADEKIEVSEAAEETKEAKEPKGTKEAKEPKGTKEPKEPKEPKAAEAPSAPRQSPIVNQQSAMVRASPLAKRLAQERKIDLSRLTGSGPGGRIVRRDIEAALSQESPVSGPPAAVHPTLRPSDATVPLTKLRQAIARRMTEGKTTVPHFYVTHEYKVDALLDLRRQFNGLLPEDEKVSINDFIVKAVALALRRFPNLNASFRETEVVRHGAVNVGVAVSVEGGLLTVVCKDADGKPLRQIAAEMKTMAGRAREGKVKPDDIEGSTFSISNMGMFEVENFAAIINPPEAAILAVGSAREVPVAEKGAIRIAWRMKATISVDHRVSDGVEAAQFMQALAEFIEEPLRLVL